jgi:hypothetical protein
LLAQARSDLPEVLNPGAIQIASQLAPSLASQPSASLSSHPVIQKVADLVEPEGYYFASVFKMLSRQPSWYVGKEDFTPPSEPDAPIQPDVIIDNTTQIMLNVTQGRVLCCPLALEGQLRHAMEESPAYFEELLACWLKLRESVDKRVSYLIAELRRYYNY